MVDKDTIYRQAAIDAFLVRLRPIFVTNQDFIESDAMKFVREVLESLPSAQKKGYTKTDYIMALHKEYGCSLARAEEAHQKALEYLRNTSMMKG